jgi:hypothetical protein
MKTNRSARRIVRIRAIVLVLALIGLSVAEVGLGGSLAARYGQYTSSQTGSSQAPNMSIGDFLATAPVVR